MPETSSIGPQYIYIMWECGSYRLLKILEATMRSHFHLRAPVRAGSSANNEGTAARKHASYREHFAARHKGDSKFRKIQEVTLRKNIRVEKVIPKLPGRIVLFAERDEFR